MKKLIIDRKTWFRGKGATDSYLLNMDGMKCCLGFYSLSCGHTKKSIELKAAPSDIYDDGRVIKKGMRELLTHDCTYHYDNPLCYQLMETNDKKMSEKTRETKISKLFKEINVNVKFIN